MKKILTVLVAAVLALLTVQALAAAAGADDGAVKIRNFAFKPATITVTKGTTVEWTNADSVTHTVSRDGGGFSGRVKSGDDFSFRFRQKGTFTYHCKIHPTMRGKVVVE